MTGELPTFPPEIYGGSFTAEEFDALPRPACPVCGQPVQLAQLDLITMADWPQQRYLVGRWSCTPECTEGIRALLGGAPDYRWDWAP